MSVQSEINRLNAIKERIRTNLVAQGITVPADTMLEAMAEQILSVAGERGLSLLYVTSAPSSYTTATGGFTPVYRIALSTVLTQAKVSEVLVGDTLCYSYYIYPIGYVDSSYVYLGTRKSIRGATGPAGAAGADYVLTDADRTEIANEAKTALANECVSISQGVSNAGKILMVDANGNLTLTDVPDIGVSGDIVGVVSENNEIILTGDLPEGVYTLKYKAEDGTLHDAGSINLESEQVVPITLTSGKIDYNNNGVIVADSSYLYSDAVDKETNKTYIVSLVAEGAAFTFRVAYYDENDNFIGVSENVLDSKYVVVTGAWPLPMPTNAKKFRLRIGVTQEQVAATKANLVLTKRNLVYTNLLPNATDASGNVLNGVGYKNGYRFAGYSGNMSQDTAQDGYFATGYMPYTIQQAKDRVPFYIKGITLDLTSLPERLIFAFSIPGNAEWIGACVISDMTDETKFTITQLGERYYMFRPNTGLWSLNAWQNKNPVHMRWTLPGATGEGVIITVNEPIM